MGGFVNVYGYGQINVSLRDMRVSNSYAANARLRSNMPATSTWNYSVVAPSEDGNVGNSRFKVNNCYYLSDPGTVDIDLMDDGTSQGLPGRELGDLKLDGFTWADAGHTFSWSAGLSGKAYPYPTATTGADGQPIHYGDWYGSGTAAEEEQEADQPQPAEKTA